MQLILKFDRAILLDEVFDWTTLKENEVIVGQVNGRRASTHYLSDEQWEDIRKQAKE